MKTLIYEVIAAAGAIDAIGYRILRPHGLTPMTFNILNVLSNRPLSQREIGEQVIVAASSITFQVRQLEKKGLIQRQRADARTWQVSLTPLGERTRRAAERSLDQRMAQIHLEPALVSNAESALKALREHLARISH